MVTFDTLDETPRFRIVIREPQPCCALPPLDFSAGPVPPGGLYAFEQQQRIGPFVAQPLFVIDIMPLAYAVAGAFKDARRAHDRRSAHEEMQRDIAQYCAAQSNRGAGIQICDTSPATR